MPLKQGPNVKKLIARRMSSIAIPSGGGLADGVAFLQDAERIIAVAKEATEWVTTALALVKAAPDNPHGDNDEEIAGAILRRIEQENDSEIRYLMGDGLKGPATRFE